MTSVRMFFLLEVNGAIDAPRVALTKAIARDSEAEFDVICVGNTCILSVVAGISRFFMRFVFAVSS